MFKSKPLYIYVHETDAAGVVHHSNYLRFFEVGRIEFLRSIGEKYINLQNNGYGLIPVDIQIRYLKPLRQDDQYIVTVELIKLKKASFTIKQTIICNDSTYVNSTIKLACVKEPEFKPIKLPEDTHNKLINYL